MDKSLYIGATTDQTSAPRGKAKGGTAPLGDHGGRSPHPLAGRGEGQRQHNHRRPGGRGQEEGYELSWETRPITVIHDTDIHGATCGINAIYALVQSKYAPSQITVYSHFSTTPSEPTTTPSGLVQVLQSLGRTDLIVLDIPVDIRNPRAYVEALITHAQYRGKVFWADHHGHSEWVSALNKCGVTAVVVGSSYDLSMLFPRMYDVVDSFVEGWSIIGAIADFDPTIAPKVPTDLEEDVCDILDQTWKVKREQLMRLLGISSAPHLGNIGQITWDIALRRIEPEKVIEAAKQLSQPLQLPQYGTIGDVVYTTQLPPPGLAWKTAWKLCLVTGCKAAVVPAFNPRLNQYTVIIARYWRTSEEIAQVIENYVQRRFAGRQIVGHPGARSVALFSQNELQMIPEIARELAEELERQVYTPRTVRLINERVVAEALHKDFTELLRAIKELLRQQTEMYREYLDLKRRQVELLEQLRQREARAD